MDQYLVRQGECRSVPKRKHFEVASVFEGIQKEGREGSEISDRESGISDNEWWRVDASIRRSGTSPGLRKRLHAGGKEERLGV